MFRTQADARLAAVRTNAHSTCMALQIEWSASKTRGNLRKHGVSFAEAATVFADPLSLTVPEPVHSIGEYRFATIGRSSLGRTLVVVHADRGDNIRIVSSRLATRRERSQYEEG